jgi:hypothetical protein
MKRYIEFPTDGGEPIVVEVDVDEQGRRKAGRSGKVVEKANVTFEQALSVLRPVADAALEHIRHLKPDEATVEFGVTVNGEASAVLASAGTEANVKVTLKWKPETPRST